LKAFENLLFGDQNQKIIHFIALHKIILFEQPVTRLPSLAQDDVAPHAVVLAVSISIDDPNPGARTQRRLQIPKQSNRLRNFVISLQQQNGVDRTRRSASIAAPLFDSAHGIA